MIYITLVKSITMKTVVRAFAMRHANTSVLRPILYVYYTPGAHPAKEYFIHSRAPVFTFFHVLVES